MGCLAEKGEWLAQIEHFDSCWGCWDCSWVTYCDQGGGFLRNKYKMWGICWSWTENIFRWTEEQQVLLHRGWSLRCGFQSQWNITRRLIFECNQCVSSGITAVPSVDTVFIPSAGHEWDRWNTCTHNPSGQTDCPDSDVSAAQTDFLFDLWCIPCGESQTTNHQQEAGCSTCEGHQHSLLWNDSSDKQTNQESVLKAKCVTIHLLYSDVQCFLRICVKWCKQQLVFVKATWRPSIQWRI